MCYLPAVTAIGIHISKLLPIGSIESASPSLRVISANRNTSPWAYSIAPFRLGSAKYSYATAFLPETTIWIDILGSVSLQHAPKLHKYYVKFLSNDENAENAHGLFLSRVMGCENRVNTDLRVVIRVSYILI
jgi:hypothetical protein